MAVTLCCSRSRILRTKDYYELLGVPRTASDDEIKKACVKRAVCVGRQRAHRPRRYRKLVLTLHPDKCRAAKAEDAFKHVTKAFEVLSDPATRQQHDRFGPEAVGSNGTGAPNPFAGFGGGGMGGGFPFGAGFAGPAGHYHSADVEELLRGLFGTGGAFGGAPGFAGGFGGGAPRQRAHRPAGGQQPQQPPEAGFGNPLAGLNLHAALPFLPVILMFAGQFLSVLPWLLRNLQFFGVLFYACPRQHRGTLMRLFAVICVLQFFVL